MVTIVSFNMHATKSIDSFIIFTTTYTSNNMHTHRIPKLLLSALFAMALLGGCKTESPWVKEEIKEQTDPVSLRGAKWNCLSIDSIALNNNQPLTIEFGADGNVSGFSGINRFSGSFTAGTGALAFGPFVATQIGGSPESRASEQRYLQALAKVKGFSLQGGLLRLMDGGKKPCMEFSR